MLTRSLEIVEVLRIGATVSGQGSRPRGHRLSKTCPVAREKDRPNRLEFTENRKAGSDPHAGLEGLAGARVEAALPRQRYLTMPEIFQARSPSSSSALRCPASMGLWDLTRYKMISTVVP